MTMGRPNTDRDTALHDSVRSDLGAERRRDAQARAGMDRNPPHLFHEEVVARTCASEALQWYVKDVLEKRANEIVEATVQKMRDLGRDASETTIREAVREHVMARVMAERARWESMFNNVHDLLGYVRRHGMTSIEE